jgi:hypothetical protein
VGEVKCGKCGSECDYPGQQLHWCKRCGFAGTPGEHTQERDRRINEAQYAGLVTTEVFTGAAGQTHSAALAAVSEGEWTSAMVGNGCAYVHTRYEYQQDRWDVGPALPAFTVLGRLVYDPRTAAVLTTATSNPALCILDFLRSEFGYQFDDSAIDFDSFAVAANVCDQIVNSVDGSNVVDGVAGRVRAGPGAGPAAAQACLPAGPLIETFCIHASILPATFHFG